MTRKFLKFKLFSGRLLNCGFTMMELIVAISILVILTVISAPIYMGNAKAARQAEGYALIGTIRSAQGNYYDEYEMYLKAEDSGGSSSGFVYNDPILGINARSNNYYTLFNINDGTEDISYGFNATVSSRIGNITMKYNRTTGVTMF